MRVSTVILHSLVLCGVSWFAWKYIWTGDREFDPDVMIKRKRVIVTGASSGIGKELTLLLCRMGANVFITARRKQLLQQLVDECTQVGLPDGTYDSFPADMSDLDTVDDVIQKGVTRLGGIDYLFLNHAYIDSKAIMFTYQKEELKKFKTVFDVNFFAYVSLLSAAMPHLRLSGGRVGVTSSILGRRADMLSSKYCATKHAIEGFFRSLDLENYFMETNVSITLIAPGYIDSGANYDEMKKTHDQLNIDWTKKFTLGLMNEPADARECADAIIASTVRREVETYFPWSYSVWGSVLKTHLFPDWLRTTFKKCKLEGQT